MEKRKIEKLYKTIKQYSFETEGKYYTKQISKKVKIKIFIDYENKKTQTEIRSFSIIKTDEKDNEKEKVSFSLSEDGTNLFKDITKTFEAFYYAFVEEEIKQVDDFSIPTKRTLTDEEKNKIIEIAKSQNILNFEDVSKYKNGLEDFEKLYEKNNISEKDWQNFFQKHLWVLGLTLQQQLLLPSKPSGELKKDDMDASLQTSSHFRIIAEIKTHKTHLIGATYRERNQENSNSLNNCYNISNDLSGGVIQILQYKQSIKDNISKQKDKDGQECYNIANFNPKCYLIIGNTEELNDEGKNECFELFRRNCKDVEIITYDEIYAKIKYIVNNFNEKSI